MCPKCDRCKKVCGDDCELSSRVVRTRLIMSAQSALVIAHRNSSREIERRECSQGAGWDMDVYIYVDFLILLNFNNSVQ